MDMDETIQHVLPTLEPHLLGRFLREIETSGPWLRAFAEECLESPFESVHIGIVDCTARNPSFNPFNLWLPLMQHGSGTMKLTILRNLPACPKNKPVWIWLEKPLAICHQEHASNR